MDTTDPTTGQTGLQAASDTRPWPRYFARSIDTFLLGGAAALAIVIVMELMSAGSSEPLLNMLDGTSGILLGGLLTLALALPIIAGLLAWAQTPGKWLFGIQVRAADGRRMRFATALKRELWVLVRGAGLGLPILTLVAYGLSYLELTAVGATRWDRGLKSDVRHAPATLWWWMRAVLGGALVAIVTAWSIIDIFRSILAS